LRGPSNGREESGRVGKGRGRKGRKRREGERREGEGWVMALGGMDAPAST